MNSQLKLTKTSKNWMKDNENKVKLLMDYGMCFDSIKVVAWYIGSSSNDKRAVCPYCGDIYSVKSHKIYKMTGQYFSCDLVLSDMEEVIEDIVNKIIKN